jgi:WD40 repeat protein
LHCFVPYPNTLCLGSLSVAFSADGQALATWWENERLKFWNVSTGAEQQLLDEDMQRYGPAVFSPDGKLLATGTSESRVAIWSLSSKQLLGTLPAVHPKGTSCLAFGADSRTLASGSKEEIAWLWDAVARRRLHELQPVNPVHRFTPLPAVRAVVFSPDVKKLAVAAGDFWLWDVTTGKLDWNKGPHRWGETSVAISPDGQSVACCGDPLQIGNPEIEILRMSDGRIVRSIYAWSSDFDQIAFTPDGRFLLHGGANNAITFWQTGTSKEGRERMEGHSGPVYALAVTPDGHRLISASHDKTIKVWDLRTGGCEATLTRHQGVVSAVAVSSDGTRLASASADCTMKIWDLNTGWLRDLPTDRSRRINAVAFSPDGKCLAFGGGDPYPYRTKRFLETWNLDTDSDVELDGLEASVNAVAYSPDGKLLASAGDDGVARIWDLATAKTTEKLGHDSRPLYCLAFSPGGDFLATAGESGGIRLWNRNAEWQNVEIPAHKNRPVYGLAFSPDSKRLASSGGDGTVRVFEVPSGKPLQTIVCAADGRQIFDVRFTPDGRHLATANGNGTIYILRLDAQR